MRLEGGAGGTDASNGTIPGFSSGGEMGEDGDERVKHHRKVALEQNKLILDGKM